MVTDSAGTDIGEIKEEDMVDALNQDGSMLKEKFISKHITG